jgi:hypothetical protein
MAYTIVSFCGGGIRGLMSATILQNLANHNGNILTHTNLLAGTSTGAGIVSSLIANESVLDIIAGFSSERTFFASVSTNPDAPAYSNSAFIQAQSAMHGEKTLSSLLPQQVLLTGFNLGSGPGEGGSPTAWYPQLFTNVHSPLTSTASTSIVEAVVASGSMPGMMPSYLGNVDGAFVNHDPTLAAIALAVSSGIDLEDIAAICIGTGFMENWIGSDTTQWGTNQWLQGDGTKNYQLPPLLTNETGVCPILNLCLNGTSTNLIPLLCQMLLPGRYVNLNPVLDQYVSETTTDQTQLGYLVSQAEALLFSDTWTQAIQLLDTYW